MKDGKKRSIAHATKDNFFVRKSFFRFDVFLTFLSLLVFQAVGAEEVIKRDELKEISENIRKAESALTNIKIEAEAWVENGPSPTGPWLRTPIYWYSTTWFSGNWSTRAWNDQDRVFEQKITGKARVDVHLEVLEWQDGAAPYAESSSSFSFDGKCGRVIDHTRGCSGKPFPVKQGKVLAEAPRILGSGPYKNFSGIGFSLQFFDSEIFKFSKFFELASDPNSEVATELKFCREKFEGVDCIKMSSKFGNLIYWLDPSNGFALRGKKSVAQYEDGHEELVSFMKVNKLKEIAPGIWWPMEVSVISRPYGDGKPWRRFAYKALEVVANDPNSDESMFTVPFPDGYLIDDQVTGKNYRVGEEPNAPPK